MERRAVPACKAAPPGERRAGDLPVVRSAAQGFTPLDRSHPVPPIWPCGPAWLTALPGLYSSRGDAVMKLLSLTLMFGLCLLAAASPASAGEVKLQIRNGRVTLEASNATVREILAEWARVGGTRFVNAERVPGGPVTLLLTDVPEAKALDTVLRSVSGYMAAPRPAAAPGASVYDR
ncbi:MAG: hypothetical protein EHM13_05510, partial [Acidobacteria bacterium]